MGVGPGDIMLQAVVEVRIPDPRSRNPKDRPVVVIGFDDEDDSRIADGDA